MFLRDEDKATGETALLAPAKVSPDFSVQDVLAWALTKPADEEYPYHNIKRCALFQFCRAQGLPVAHCGGSDWCDKNGERHRLLPADCNAAGAYPWTFGAFAARLREIV